LSSDPSFAWISFSHATDTENFREKFKKPYSVKKPLLAASCVLQATLADEGGSLLLSAEIKAKVPFKEEYRFHVTTLERGESSPGPAFCFHTERNQNQETESRWDFSGGKLQLSKGAQGSFRQSRTSFEKWSENPVVLSPLQLVLVLGNFLNGGHQEYGAQIVAGSGFAALLLTREGAVTPAGMQKFNVRYATFIQPVDEELWKKTDWQSKKPIELIWNTREMAIEKIAFSLSIVGSIELKRS
jgi:hypothetical protein